MNNSAFKSFEGVNVQTINIIKQFAEEYKSLKILTLQNSVHYIRSEILENFCELNKNHHPIWTNQELLELLDGKNTINKDLINKDEVITKLETLDISFKLQNESLTLIISRANLYKHLVNYLFILIPTLKEVTLELRTTSTHKGLISSLLKTNKNDYNNFVGTKKKLKLLVIDENDKNTCYFKNMNENHKFNLLCCRYSKTSPLRKLHKYVISNICKYLTT